VFVAVGLMSAVPTVALIRWRRAGLPARPSCCACAHGSTRNSPLLPLIPALAALMARGIGH
jgi:uncharacterized membrane protein